MFIRLINDRVQQCDMACLFVFVSFLKNSSYWLFSVSKYMFDYMQDFKQAVFFMLSLKPEKGHCCLL